MKSFARSLVGAAAMACAIGSAGAATVEGSLFQGENLLSDNSAESLINAAGGPDTIVDVGDRLRGIFAIDTIEDLSGAGGTRSLLAGSGNNELSGLFDVTVTSKTVTGAGPTLRYTFTFGPTPTFAAEAGGNLGAAVVFYDGGATHDFTRTGCATEAICEATATNGTLLWVAGFGGDAFWTAETRTDNIATIGALGAGQSGGNFNIGLELLENNGSKQLNPLANCFNLVTFTPATGLEFCGSGSVLGKSGNTPFDSFDDVNFRINVSAVPEPTSLALFGLALFGLGAGSLRRKS